MPIRQRCRAVIRPHRRRWPPTISWSAGASALGEQQTGDDHQPHRGPFCRPVAAAAIARPVGHDLGAITEEQLAQRQLHQRPFSPLTNVLRQHQIAALSNARRDRPAAGWVTSPACLGNFAILGRQTAEPSRQRQLKIRQSDTWRVRISQVEGQSSQHDKSVSRPLMIRRRLRRYRRQR